MIPQDYVIAIDTQILIWGFRKDGNAQMIERARWLFEEVEKTDTQVIVPAVSVAEYLIPARDEDHLGIIESLNRRFMIMPFDVRSASLAARLFMMGKLQRKDEMDKPDARKTLKADSMIIAVAKTSGAGIFYTNDTACRNLANHVMVARDLPEFKEELTYSTASQPPSSQSPVVLRQTISLPVPDRPSDPPTAPKKLLRGSSRGQ